MTSYGPESEELLVNTIGDYEGIRPLFGEGSYYFDIDADGRWTAKVEAIERQQSAARGISGNGDFVSGLFQPTEEGPVPFTFTHNGEGNFIVYLHCGGGTELVQNEIGSANGSSVVNFTEGPCLWDVQADGRWSIKPR